MSVMKALFASAVIGLVATTARAEAQGGSGFPIVSSTSVRMRDARAAKDFDHAGTPGATTVAAALSGGQILLVSEESALRHP